MDPEHLRRACRMRDVDAVKTLVRDGTIDVELVSEGWKAIDDLILSNVSIEHWDSEMVSRVVEIMSVLREAGATPGRYMNLQQLLRERAPAELVDALFRIFPEYDATSASRQLFHAVTHRCGPEVIRCLIRHGADPNYVYECFYPESCLHLAVSLGDEDTTRVLLDFGANPYRKDYCGHDALFWHIHAQTVFIDGMYNVRDRRYPSRDRLPPSPAKSIMCDVFECKKSFHALKDDLHKELIEYVCHPARLQRFGYFDCCVIKQQSSSCAPAWP